MTDHRQPGGRTPSSREPDERLADWVDGRMSDRDRERFTAELRVNAQLRADLAEYERTVASIRAALQAPTVPLPRRDAAVPAAAPTLADRVLAQVQGQAPVRSLRVAGGGIAWRPVLWSCASAAALLVLTLLLDSWSAEPVATSGTSVTRLDTASAAAPDDGSALPLDRLLAPPTPVALEQESRKLQAEVAATPAADRPVAPPSAELAEGSGATDPAATDTAGAGNQPAELGATELGAAELGAAELGAGAGLRPSAEPEAKSKARGRDAAPASPQDVVPPAPEMAPAPAAVPPPGSSRAEKVSADEPRAEEPSQDQSARLERAFGVDARPQATDAPIAGATANRGAAVAPWSLLLVDGVQPLAVRTGGGPRGAAPDSGPAGPSTGGPAGPAAPARPAAPAAPAGGGAMPAGTELEQRLDAFLATAVQADAAPLLELPTQRGRLRLWRLPLTELPRDLARPADGRPVDDPLAGAVPPLEASWAVEGPEADVEILLQRVRRLVREPELRLRTGETAAPPPPAAASAAASTSTPAPAASAPAAVSAQRQLVLRFRLRPR